MQINRARRLPGHTGYTPLPEETTMNIDKAVFRFAGVIILVSLILSQLHSVYWLWLTAFVGLNMLQASFTGFCPMAMILARTGMKPGAAFCAKTSP
jgi:hypothetical protein